MVGQLELPRTFVDYPSGDQGRRHSIIVRCQNPPALGEGASEAYKDVSNVVDVLQHAGIVRTVTRMRPLTVIKG